MPVGKNTSFSQSNKLARARAAEFQLRSHFKYGYRNKEDFTNLPPGVLISPSQNVLTNASERVQIRKGYTLDGQANTTLFPIRSSFDFLMHNGVQHHLRQWSTKLEFRNVDANGVVTWNDLLLTLPSTGKAQFATFWDFITELKTQLLFVDQVNANIYEWSGGVTTVASVTGNTVTNQGSSTFAQLGFYNVAGNSARFQFYSPAGILYTYTGGGGTQTLTGVTPDPTLDATMVAGALIFQKVATFVNNSDITGLPTAFINGLIANLRNQIYVGSLTNSSVYISKVNNYKDFSFTSPTRVVGEGSRVDLDASPVALIPQEDRMYMAAGKDFWYETKWTLSADLTKEAFEISKLKTAAMQAPVGQSAVTTIQNNVVFVSNEPIVYEFGRMASILQTPQLRNLSDPILGDLYTFNLTDASVVYWRNFIYFAFPAESKVLIYNIVKKYWEAPQILPVGNWAIIGGELYGHDYNVPQTYKMFTGHNDNGHAINAIAAWSYEQAGSRFEKKNMSKFYTEGYIQSNTKITLTLKFDFGGFTSILNFDHKGTDPGIIFATTADGSIGKFPIGKNPIGSITDSVSDLPKFRVIDTAYRQDFFEYQFQVSSNDIDQDWEILALGGNAGAARAMPVEITK